MSLNHQTNAATINVSQLATMVEQHGCGHRLIGQQTHEKVMEGQFAFANFPSGIHVHGNDAIESGDLSSSTQLPASLSFNIVIEGTIDFSLAGTAHQIEVQPNQKGICAVSTLAYPDLLTRKLRRGQRVRKVNIFVERRWLEMRCQNNAEMVWIEQLFSNHAQLYQWGDDKPCIEMAEKILAAQQYNNFANNLEIEQLALALLARAMEILPQKVAQAAIHRSSSVPLQQSSALLHSNQRWQDQADAIINESLDKRHFGINHLANALGISVSTLQRRFKSTFGLTVAECIRYKRLERAKVAIALDGVSIGEAAYQAGYNHVSNFISAFKKHFHMTPASLLKSHGI